MERSRSHRLAHIDSIRGVAALMVAFMHFGEGFADRFQNGLPGEFLYTVFTHLDFGRAGVLAFFAISGFVICPSLKGTRRQGSRKFLISRFFRLYPAFWTSILLFLLIQWMWRSKPVDAGQILGNVTMVYSLFGVEPLQGLYWTLEVELVFYLLCLALFLLGWLHSPLVLFVVGMLLMALSEAILDRAGAVKAITETFSIAWPYMPWNLAVMFWGGLFRMWYDDRRRTCAVIIPVPVGLLVGALLVAILWRPWVLCSHWISTGQYGQLHYMVPYFLGLGVFIVGALFIRLEHGFFVWLGTISYSLYLFHPIAYGLVRPAVNATFPALMDIHLGVSILLCVLGSILLSALVYYAVEKPAIRLGRHLQNRSTLAPAPAVS